jgi:hypothetical protein
VPKSVGTVISANRASLIELQTVYGVRDLYNLLEIVMVDFYNKHQLEKHARDASRG